MKNIFFCLIVLATISCSTSKKVISTSVKENVTPETVVIATAVKDASGNLIGIANKESFLQKPYSNWFNPNYEGYPLNN